MCDVASNQRRVLSKDVEQWFSKRNANTLQGSLSFVPWILQQSYFERSLNEGSIICHRGTGVVVFSDASGFTALTEKLAKKRNGAELLSQCLTAFFTPLINLINSYRGDVIKFSGDALTIYFPAVDDTKGKQNPRAPACVPPHGSYGLPDLGPMATAVLRASACCVEIHKRLHMFDTGVDGVRLCLHIGVGCGQVAILQVGGVIPPETHVPRCEYIIAGPPLEQISVAEPLAKNGETCLSPQAWEYVKEAVIEGAPLEDRPDYHLLARIDETKYTFPTIKRSAMLLDTRAEQQFKADEVNFIRRYIPSAVFKQIECGTLTYVNEMRKISTVFISGSGLDVCTEEGSKTAQDLTAAVQKCCYAHEGTLNKFVIDDKGMLFLLVYGLPPLVHTDDPTRALLACFDMVKVFMRYNLVGRFGVSTGRNYCGVCGSAMRMEYTVLGDTVNLAARLMAHAPPNGIFCDEATKQMSMQDVNFVSLAPIQVKGKKDPIPVFQPTPKPPPPHLGVDPRGRIYPPWYHKLLHGACIALTPQKFQVPIPPGLAVLEGDELVTKMNCLQLCSLQGWESMSIVQRLLGGQFQKSLHSIPTALGGAESPVKPPEDSPFSSGGVLVLEGRTGSGKVEIAEHVVCHAVHHFKMMPVFGSMGPRPGKEEQIAVELLRSALGAFRHFDNTVPLDDIQALVKLVPPQYASSLPAVRQALDVQNRPEAADPIDVKEDLLASTIEVVVAMLELLQKKTPLLIVLQLEFGTNLFNSTLSGFRCFWTVFSLLQKLALPKENTARNPADKTTVLMILCKHADKLQPAVKVAIDKGWFVECKGLHEDEDRIEYMAMYLNVPAEMMPDPLQKFVATISIGNPLYIRETIDQLLDDDHIKVHREGEQALSLQYHQDLESINISTWGHTAMVGETVCLLESLDPMEAAALKMSTCFEGPFALRDLASSNCSQWAGATHFDYLRLLRAVHKLVAAEILQEVTQDNGVTRIAVSRAKASCNSSCPSQHDRATGRAIGSAHVPEHRNAVTQIRDTTARISLTSIPYKGPDSGEAYLLNNVLIRKIGGSMVLDAQRKSVKRQALVDRALTRELPVRMRLLRKRTGGVHIPWYYEQVLKGGSIPTLRTSRESTDTDDAGIAKTNSGLGGKAW
eukprot:gnl/TRDRNA2_/TRDRNA2_163608_c0_seq1.p1 gnl/TRDRNA2_/TRDRNA2_163608_c0~~gnl/TRDRNA2_/TRDRNA2_163608_c0_seq1.p1  ORF type:complete len:1239 (+),score=222.08 gnl/TRDRNA2_/TRDRNA2_163608_c0_seq1:303-3719(+)